MIPILSFLAGAAIGLYRATKRGGTKADIAWYAAIHGIIGLIVGTLIAVLVIRV